MKGAMKASFGFKCFLKRERDRPFHFNERSNTLYILGKESKHTRSKTKLMKKKKLISSPRRVANSLGRGKADEKNKKGGGGEI